jgi:hypothetical protein
MKVWRLIAGLIITVNSFGTDQVTDELGGAAAQPEALLQPESEPVAESTVTVDPIMPKTLNTTGSDDSGNWVLKRVWWERSEDTFGQIMAYNAQVADQQLDFFAMRHDLEKQLEEARQKLGITPAELVKVVDHLLAMLNQQGDQLPETSVNQFRNTVADNKEKLVALQVDLSLMQKIDADLDSLMLQVVDQTQKCADYESKAWVDFKQIGRVLNDHKAQELFYQVESYQKNIQLVLQYLKGDLKDSFDKYGKQALQKLLKIGQLAQELKDAGIDLVYEFKAMDEGVGQLPVEPQPAKEVVKKPVKSGGFFGMVMNILSSLVNLLLFLPRKLLGLVGIKF